MILDEAETAEREGDGGDGVVPRGRESAREPFVVEGGGAAPPRGIDEEEPVAARYRLPVPEPTGLPDPVRLLGHVHYEVVGAGGEAVRPHVIRQRTLRAGRADEEQVEDGRRA